MASIPRLRIDFRDIRSDLKDRLKLALEQRNYHEAKAKELSAVADELAHVLERENARFPGDTAQAITAPTIPLDDFVLQELTTSPMTKEQLRECATKAGYNNDNLGRSIHAVTLNLTRGGKISEVSGILHAIKNTT
jgi:hypothetical protein